MREASPRWWATLLVLVVASVAYYAFPAREPSPLVLEGPTMGTRYRVVLYGNHGVDEAAVRAAVQQKLDRVVALMSTYDPSSELSRINASSSTEPLALTPETRAVVSIALEVWRRSDGAFDVIVGPLVELWGFGSGARPPEPPSEAAIDEALRAVGSGKIDLGEAGLTKGHPQLRLDLSAVAKGYAVDLVAEALEGLGVERYLVEVGGEVRTRGERERGRGFRLAIESPIAEGRAAYTVVQLRDRALATSGNYRNFYERDGIRYAHTISPKTGRPVKHRLLSASVLHASCAWADAWATALMASGDDAWRLARAHELDVLLLYATADGGIEERVTDGFQRLRLPTAPP